ncbi:MAG: inositol phosphatase [Phycisphaeraceae bacterium]|nr:inositol phosphatase [Phycisphaeraceae bacterium]
MTVARLAAEAGGHAALERYERGVTRQRKEDGSFVTEADLAAEQAILKIIAQAFPEHSVLSEESGVQQGDPALRWIVDPLDGTHRFARGLRFWGPLVALLHKDVVVAGAMSMPVVNETYWAAQGHGCWLNGERCRVSDVQHWSEANLSLGSLSRLVESPAGKGVMSLVGSCDYTISGGDLSGVALLLKGEAEAWLECGVKPWDVAPMAILVPEAGGVITDIAGADTIETGSACATNAALSAHVRKTLGIA